MATQGKSQGKRSARKTTTKTATTSRRSEAVSDTRRPKGTSRTGAQRGAHDTTRKAATKTTSSPATKASASHPRKARAARAPKADSTERATSPARVSGARKDNDKENAKEPVQQTQRPGEAGNLRSRLMSGVKHYGDRSQAVVRELWGGVVPGVVARARAQTRALTDRCRGLLGRASHMMTALHLPGLRRRAPVARRGKQAKAIPLPAAALLART